MKVGPPLKKMKNFEMKFQKRSDYLTPRFLNFRWTFSTRQCACVRACVSVCVCVKVRKRERICTIASGHTSVCVYQDTDTFFNPGTGQAKLTRLVNWIIYL